MKWLKKTKYLFSFLLVSTIYAGSQVALAEDNYPSKPISIVVAYTPGGANDIVGRLVAHHLGEELGENVVVENRPGASGIVGTSAVARAPADGYTLLLGAGGTMTMNPGLFKDLQYDPINDFAPIGFAARSPLVVVTSPSLPVDNIAELIEYAKNQEEKITLASPGMGTPLHLAGELFAKQAGIEMEHIPYQGSVPALNDIMADRVDVMFDVMGSSLQLIKDGKLKALAVTTTDRSQHLPEVPTVEEQGLAGY